MSVLVTRPRGDCERTVAALATRGIAAIAAPALEMRFYTDIPLSGPVRALLITSANALRAIAGQAEIASLLDVPLYAVGDRTAEAARELGFHDVRSAGGTVGDMANLVRAGIAPGDGRLVHLSGRDTAGDITGMLARAGYDTERVVVYEAVPANALPADAVEALKDGRVEAVLLYSPRSAEAFSGLVKQAGLGGRLKDVSALAISQNVAETARAAGFGHISVAAAAEESALFDALFRLLGK